jgi:hypothetical protein
MLLLLRPQTVYIGKELTIVIMTNNDRMKINKNKEKKINKNVDNQIWISLDSCTNHIACYCSPYSRVELLHNLRLST